MDLFYEIVEVEPVAALDQSFSFAPNVWVFAPVPRVGTDMQYGTYCIPKRVRAIAHFESSVQYKVAGSPLNPNHLLADYQVAQTLRRVFPDSDLLGLRLVAVAL